ncbi:MAG: putative maltokinase [Chloroflexota bacterium]
MAEQPFPRVPVALPGAPSAAWLVAALPELLETLPVEWLRRRRWFGDKAQAIARLTLRDGAPLGDRPPAALALVDVDLADGRHETYSVPLAVRRLGEAMAVLGADLAQAYLEVETPDGEVLVLYDALADPDCGRALFRQIEAHARLAGARGEFVFGRTPALAGGSPLGDVRRLGGEQSNTSVVYDDAFVLKAYRKLLNGPNPDLEVPCFLTTSARFPHVPPVAGSLAYASESFSATLACLQVFVANAGDGWAYTLSHLHQLFEYVSSVLPAGTAPDAAAAEALAQGFSAAYLRDLRRLGEITAEMHSALASRPADADFAPEGITVADVDGWVGAMEAQLATAVRLAAMAAADQPEPARRQLRGLAESEAHYRERFASLRRLAGASIAKIRHHGDYHLGQVLRTADGFVVVDFEGEPARTLAERRAKHLALRDVAGMLRSFDYAVYAALFEQPVGADLPLLEAHGLAWERLAGAAFMEGYLLQTHGTDAVFLPPDTDRLRLALDVLTLDKAVYELIYELNNRPGWVRIPLAYIVGSKA